MGLNDEEVKVSRSKNGSNTLEKSKSNSFLKLLIESLGDPIIKILLIALAIKVVFLFKNFDWFETLGIMIAIFLASFISTISEYGSNKAFERLQKESEEISVKVYRNNHLCKIPSSQIVVGDIVKITSGDKIPADGHIIKGSISVNEAFLTGEAKEIYKKEKTEVFGGSLVYKGNADVKIDKVGINTYMGKISSQMQTSEDESPLRKRLRILAGQISRLGYVGAFLASFSYLFMQIFVKNNFDFILVMQTLKNIPLMFNYLIYCLTLAVTIIIMAVPEGLPMMITIVLSSNMKRMLKDNVLVRKMVGIETSGSLNVLLFDKTGTLTEGVHHVNSLVSKEGKVIKDIHELKKYPNYQKIVSNMLLLNNESTFENGSVIGGNSTDQALLLFIKDYQTNIRVLDRKPFDSEHKYSYVYASDNYYYIKGASEIIIAKCNKYLKTNGEIGNILSKSLLLNEIKKYTDKGYRVISCAYGKNLNELIFIGFVTISDKIRKEAKDSINEIKKAGIKPIMITGDSKETAISIASQIGLLNEKSIVLTHDDLQNYNDQKLSDIASNITVIARALPEDKSRLVNIYKNLGLVVGMTGDGVNDAIALKKSDVSFALGSGSEVAKEASDIVILDNNISSICKAILYGRTIFKSIRKFIIYQLTVNICALLLSIIGVLIGFSTPITIIQMLWLNMIMDTFAGLAFSYEPPLKEYMEEKPKKRDEKILNKYMLNQIVFNGLYSTIICILFLKLPFIKNMIRYSADNIYLLTAFFALFIFMGIVNSFLSRTHRLNILANIHKNKVFIVINLLIIISQIYIIYYGGSLFRTYGLNFNELLLVIVLSLSIIPFDFLRKEFLKKKGVSLGV